MTTNDEETGFNLSRMYLNQIEHAVLQRVFARYMGGSAVRAVAREFGYDLTRRQARNVASGLFLVGRYVVRQESPPEGKGLTVQDAVEVVKDWVQERAITFTARRVARQTTEDVVEHLKTIFETGGSEDTPRPSPFSTRHEDKSGYVDDPTWRPTDEPTVG